MKKKDLPSISCILASALFIIAVVPVRAQVVSDPSTWFGFVNGNGNPLVSDTFRLQTFDVSPLSNWLYTTDGGAALFDGRKAGFSDQEGDLSLKMPTGSSVCFEPFPADTYNNVYICLHYGATGLMIGENLTANTYRTEANARVTLCNIIKNNEFNELRTQRIPKNPSALDLLVLPASSSTKNGFYCIDSVYAYGSIRQYSLFTGTGYWNDTLRWSHLPVARHRNALISGEVTANAAIRCNDVWLNGCLTIPDGTDFHAHNLTLIENSSSLISSGSLSIGGRLTVSKTFQEKGKWYFVSFPFDVYEKGIDSRFKLKDDTFSGSGNYFYVQQYDTDSRASANKAEGNWRVVSASRDVALPLFEKNKGYLVAIDAGADDRTLTFTSEAGTIPDNFGKEGVIAVNLSAEAAGQGEHCGWYLCGNPLPAPLALSRITTSPALDGNIYLYEEGGYKAYPVGSDYMLPPYCAFFVKASASAEIRIMDTSHAATGKLLFSPALSGSKHKEPEQGAVVTATAEPVGDQAASFIRDKDLYLVNMPGSGWVRLLSPAGQLLFERTFQSGSSCMSLPLKAGLYFINIHTDRYQAQYKFILKD